MSADAYIVVWSGSLDRAGLCPSLNRYEGQSQLAVCKVKGHGAILQRGDLAGMRTGEDKPKADALIVVKPAKRQSGRFGPVLLNRYNQHSVFCRCRTCDSAERKGIGHA